MRDSAAPLPLAMNMLEEAAGPELTLAAQIAEGQEVNAQTDMESEADLGPFGVAIANFLMPEPVVATTALRTTLYDGSAPVPPGVELVLLGNILVGPMVHGKGRGGRGGHGVAYAHTPKSQRLLLNVTDPFCLISVGVQGAGKSHTLGCVLEGCLLEFSPFLSVRQPMSVLVCHYDQSESNCCEATGLAQPHQKIKELLSAHRAEMPCRAPPCLDKGQLLVLCSPSYYKQRKEYYAGVCEVRPLLLRWSRIKAQQLKKLMQLDESSTQLYVALMLEMLRSYQRHRKVPPYHEFVRMLESEFSSPSQAGPLKQRLQLLSAFVYEADVNESLRGVGVDLADVMEAGRMVVADLTDPMMSPADANGVFQVLLETFRFKRVAGAGKLVAFDEAHRYMGLNGQSDALAREITDCVRLMRHEGIRLVLSTQSPKAMPEELLELTTVLMAHRYQSSDWHSYLSKKVPLPEHTFSIIRELSPGEALVYSARPSVGTHNSADQEESDNGLALPTITELLKVKVRTRLTADRGASRINRVGQTSAGTPRQRMPA